MLQSFEPQLSAPLHYASAPTPPISGPVSPATTPASTVQPASHMVPAKTHNIFIVTGPAGCGKSTVAQFLAERYDFKYIEGDDFHPPANIEKMGAGTPLNDADRWDWLIVLRDQALAELNKGAKGVVVTCSALKKKYRDVIRTAQLYDSNHATAVHFVYLRASKEVLLDRVGARKDHYMKNNMVLSQLADLEEPDAYETQQLKDVDIIDVSVTQEEVKKLATHAIDRIVEKL